MVHQMFSVIWNTETTTIGSAFHLNTMHRPKLLPVISEAWGLIGPVDRWNGYFKDGHLA
jgi:CBS-domain-containing membrane protein